MQDVLKPEAHQSPVECLRAAWGLSPIQTRLLQLLLKASNLLPGGRGVAILDPAEIIVP